MAMQEDMLRKDTGRWLFGTQGQDNNTILYIAQIILSLYYFLGTNVNTKYIQYML